VFQGEGLCGEVGGRQRVLRIYYSSSVMAGAVARLVTVLLILKEAGVSRIARW